MVRASGDQMRHQGGLPQEQQVALGVDGVGIGLQQNLAIERIEGADANGHVAAAAGARPKEEVAAVGQEPGVAMGGVTTSCVELRGGSRGASGGRHAHEWAINPGNRSATSLYAISTLAFGFVPPAAYSRLAITSVMSSACGAPAVNSAKAVRTA
jgi:hypothetical protein